MIMHIKLYQKYDYSIFIKKEGGLNAYINKIEKEDEQVIIYEYGVLKMI